STAEGATCTKDVTVGAGASVETRSEERREGKEGGARGMENHDEKSNGVCPTCTVTNPTASELDTAKEIVEVNGLPAFPTTQIPPGAEVTYQITTANHGGSEATTTLTETVPAHTSFVGPAGAGGWVCLKEGVASTAEGATCTKDVTVGAGASVET